MAWKNLFCAFSNASLVKPALTHAAALAAEHKAHLDVLCLGVNRFSTDFFFAGGTAVALSDRLESCQQEALEIEGVVREVLNTQTDIHWSCSQGMAQLVDMGHLVASKARFSDLAILPAPYGPNRGPEAEPLTESVMFDAHAPTLILCDDAPTATQPRHIMIGWNESPEALQAIRASLDILKQAQKVTAVIIDPSDHGPDRSDPGGLLSQYLARHDIKIDIDVLSKNMPRVSDVLSRHALDTQADLIVMGAYGHSRFREAVFGGATRGMLERAPVPILMAR